jgi:formylglycine-generating enzyme required for sulfatase activity
MSSTQDPEQKLVIHQRHGYAQYFVEDLGNGVTLDMVLIPSGTFCMGSPKDGSEHGRNETPQHTVALPAFFMGKYPVTQSQWRAVAALSQVNQKLDADPSNFKGDNRPVERVSWLDAVEFCDRLSQHTGRHYRLPSEAEWEYACRAGTTTPFHFGETITTHLANYDGTDDPDGKWSGSYGCGPKGIYRKETTPVGSFKVANAFGLYDMHGNVWEWCQDHWHTTYNGAPTDGRAWIDTETAKSACRLLRGGSWDNAPWDCRSARRNYYGSGVHFYSVGLRLVCSA